ncbi:hypothetical protein F01_420005 [Burkholderia cenocepacia]|nr:hypothetical protein F01_420005 [Burkholderia cenocepacia]
MGGRRSAVDTRGAPPPDRRARRRQVAHPRGGLLEARRGGRARNAGRLSGADTARPAAETIVAPAQQRAWHRHRGGYICMSATPLSGDSRRSPPRSARS